jgi:hypothetical protein
VRADLSWHPFAGCQGPGGAAIIRSDRGSRRLEGPIMNMWDDDEDDEIQPPFDPTDHDA